MKKLVLFLLMGTSFIEGICKREDHHHRDANVMRCNYYQEDIYRCYTKKINCYASAQRRKECYYCGCPITEHSSMKQLK